MSTHDDALFAELRAMWRDADPVPDTLVDRMIAAVAADGLSQEYALLTLIEDRLGAVRAPTLLIVGGADHQVIELNRWAQQRLGAPNELAIVPGATHLFEEEGALAEVAILARDWFLRLFEATGDATDAAGPARA